MTALKKAELRTIHQSLQRLQPPGSLPKDPEELVRIEEARVVVARMIEEYRPLPERGALVLTWRVAREHAMTMNEYSGKKGWVKKKIRQELDRQLLALIDPIPGAVIYGKRRRWVRVTRFSPRKVDEVSADTIGGKCPIDALVRVGVLADDTQALLVREPRWEPTAPGNTHVLVEVFEVTEEGSREGEEPPPAPAPKLPPRRRSKLSTYLRDGK